jgi:MFS transporter, DHA2 family, multidrug resistance protein
VADPVLKFPPEQKGNPAVPGSMQLALDRGEQLGWLESNEIIAEAIVSIIGFYYFFAHSLTTAKPFIQFAIFKDRNFINMR